MFCFEPKILINFPLYCGLYRSLKKTLLKITCHWHWWGRCPGYRVENHATNSINTNWWCASLSHRVITVGSTRNSDPICVAICANCTCCSALASYTKWHRCWIDWKDNVWRVEMGIEFVWPHEEVRQIYCHKKYESKMMPFYLLKNIDLMNM